MDMITTRTIRSRGWLLPGVLALLAIAFGLAADSSQGKQAMAREESPLLTSASTGSLRPLGPDACTPTSTPTPTPTDAPPPPTPTPCSVSGSGGSTTCFGPDDYAW